MQTKGKKALMRGEPTPEQIERGQLYREMGLTDGEYERMKQILGRRPNYTETGLFSVMWSEHCSYKHSKPVLSKFPTSGPQVLQGPGEGAGIVDIGDGLAVVFKIESHNHPSAVAPYHGAATGVGGIVRDVFSMGARPIALLNSLRFGELDSERVRYLFDQVVAGVADYGRGVGIPTVGGEVYFDPCYEENPLVNAMCVGLLRHEEIKRGVAQGLGNLVVYLGGPTGRDGIHGATFASEELDAETHGEAPVVKGNPELERKVMEACLELIQSGYVVGMQDMGAAGLTSSSAEMASKAGMGIELNLDHVPQREAGMTAYEMMLSESQERMLMVIQPQHWEAVQEICARWDVPAAVVGRVTDDGRLRVLHQGEVKADVPVDSLASDALVYHVPSKVPTYYAERDNIELEVAEYAETLCQLLAAPTIASKEWAYKRFSAEEDPTDPRKSPVLLGPGSDAAVIRLPDTHKALALTTDGNSRYIYLDPKVGGAIAVAEAARNIVCSGGKPLAVTDGLNFGSPEDPEIFWQLEQAAEGISAACQALATPVVSGNVSLYNESKGKAVYPTPIIGMVGVVEHLDQVTGQGFCREDEQIVLLGETKAEFGGSEVQKLIEGKISGRPPQIDLEREREVQTVVSTAIRRGWLSSAHDLSEGGFAVALAESCLSGGRGAEVELESSLSATALLFSESQSRVLVSLPQEHVEALLQLAETHQVPAQVIGRVLAVGDDSPVKITINGEPVVDLPLSRLSRAWKESIPCRMQS